MTVLKKCIYIHIGTPKTGTTSIQKYITIHRSRLRRDGWLVPTASRGLNENHMHLSNYAMDRSKECVHIRSACNIDDLNDISRYREVFYDKLRAEIQRHRGEYVIMSSEQCYMMLDTPDEIQRLKDLFKDLAQQIQIIVYIREQSDMLCSRYSTFLMNNHTKTIRSCEAFAKIPTFDYSKRLQMWEDIFGIENIILRVFDRQKLHGQDIIQDMCKEINLPIYSHRALMLNTTLNAKQCEFLRLINSQMGVLRGHVGVEARHAINRMVSGTQIDSPPVSVLIDKRYQTVYVDSNTALAKRYFQDAGPIFNMKPLRDTRLDQNSILSPKDKTDLATQIISKHARMYSVLCRCIAVIFDVPFRGKRIPQEYLDKFNIHAYYRKRKWSPYRYIILCRRLFDMLYKR